MYTPVRTQEPMIVATAMGMPTVMAPENFRASRSGRNAMRAMNPKKSVIWSAVRIIEMVFFCATSRLK